MKEDWEHFDHLQLRDDINSVYHDLRTKCPVAHSDQHGGFWVLSRFNDIYAAMHDPKTYSSAEGITVPSFGNVRPLIPLEVNPPEHGKYRRLLQPLFLPAEVAKLELNIRTITNTLLDSFVDQGTCDLATDFALRLPQTVIARLIGVPENYYGKFDEWVEGLAGEEKGDRKARAAAEMYECLSGLMAERRKEPRDDLISRLLAADIDGERLTDEEILDITFVLLPAGFETTATVMAHALWYLAEHPDAQVRLRTNPALIPSAVEEFLRYYTPNRSIARTLHADVELHGQQMRKGDKVIVLLPSANRDEEEFPEADQCILDRKENQHIAFGTGIHTCLGLHLARLEIKVALEEFLRRIPEFRVPEGGKIVRRSGLVWPVISAPVELGSK